MATEIKMYRIHYNAGAPQDVQAEMFGDGGHEGKWIDFKFDGSIVLRVRSEDVKSIEMPKPS